MAILTATQQLEEVQSCISALLAGGQTVELEGQRLTMASLEALTKREDMLRARVAAEARSGRYTITVGTNR